MKNPMIEQGRNDRDELAIKNCIHDAGGKLRIMRVRGILHIGVEQNGGTEWADVNVEDLVEALKILDVRV